MKLKEQTADINRKHLEFIGKLKGIDHIKLGPMWPCSGTYEGIQKRTDIAIALVKEGILNFDGYSFTVGDRAVQIGPQVWQPGKPIRLSWLDESRLEKELTEDIKNG